ncbi:hypothetical protein VTK26DRAFT_4141 [Humicola hyalothermophila]
MQLANPSGRAHICFSFLDVGPTTQKVLPRPGPNNISTVERPSLKATPHQRPNGNIEGPFSRSDPTLGRSWRRESPSPRESRDELTINIPASGLPASLAGAFPGRSLRRSAAGKPWKPCSRRFISPPRLFVSYFLTSPTCSRLRCPASIGRSLRLPCTRADMEGRSWTVGRGPVSLKGPIAGSGSTDHGAPPPPTAAWWILSNCRDCETFLWSALDRLRREGTRKVKNTRMRSIDHLLPPTTRTTRRCWSRNGRMPGPKTKLATRNRKKTRGEKKNQQDENNGKQARQRT